MRKDVQDHLQRNRGFIRKKVSEGDLPNFIESDFVPVARSDFNAGEKLCLRWRGPVRISRALNDLVYQVQDLRNGCFENAHISRLKFFSDSNLDTEAIMSHVLSSKTRIPVSRLMKLVRDGSLLKVLVHWGGLPASEDNLESIQQMFENVSVLLKRSLKRENTPRDLAQHARKLLCI